MSSALCRSVFDVEFGWGCRIQVVCVVMFGTARGDVISSSTLQNPIIPTSMSLVEAVCRPLSFAAGALKRLCKELTDVANALKP